MLHTNLSTRPFYNERAVHLVLALLALAVVGLTTLNVKRLVALSARHTALARQTAADLAAAAALDRDLAALDRTTERRTIDAVAAAAREVNDLIDRRTFSWTEFFNLIEATLPADVMLTAVRPEFEGGAVQVSLTVVGKTSAQLGAFMDELEQTGAFTDVLVRQEEVTDRGLHRAVLQGRYLGRPAAHTAAEAPRQSTRAGS